MCVHLVTLGARGVVTYMIVPFSKLYQLRMTPKERGMILGGIRTAFSRSSWAAKQRALATAESKGPRGGKLYTCSACGSVSNISGINVDHVSPVVPIGKRYTDFTWDQLVARLWCDESNLQVLCKKCHKKKSKEEASARRKAKQRSKSS